MRKAVSTALLICSLLFNGQYARSQMAGDFITFDPPGSTSTISSGITPAGVVTGYYTDTSNVTHGFLRTLAGAFTTFDPPRSKYTQPTAINPVGAIVGAYYPDAACFTFQGFVRMPDGTFTTFVPPGGFILPGIFNFGGPPPGITPAGVIAGTYSVLGPTANQHGFLRTPDGTFTTFDPPGSVFTQVLAINPAGAITGDYCDAVACHGFVRAPNESIATFDNPAGGIAINPAGAVVGGNAVRAPDGTVIEFNPPGAQSTTSLAINPDGVITGYYCDAVACHDFLRTPNGAITPFDPPSSTFTVGTEINPAGVIVGAFMDASGVAHGFLFFPKH
jgi:hypothetical protein